jgi:tRNA A37 threonylcarbamoyladenosine biosynthesis protein TsaE
VQILCFPAGICLIEWPDRIPATQMPVDPLEISLHINEDTSREVRIRYGNKERWAAKVQEALKGAS